MPVIISQSMRISDHLREHLMSIVGGYYPDPRPGLDELKSRRWCDKFEELRKNRLIMGAFRYEAEDLNRPPEKSFNNTASIKRRILAYEEYGDTELLVDIANLCMLEFRSPGNPKAHWGSTGEGHDFHVDEV